MINIIQHKSILTSEDAFILNPVNCIGIMGKGLALQFRKLYPSYFLYYKELCKNNKIKLGNPYIHYEKQYKPNSYFISFPTIYKPYNIAKIEDIKKGLEIMIKLIESYKSGSFAIPALGCGNGQLNIVELFEYIEKNFSDYNINFYDYNGDLNSL